MLGEVSITGNVHCLYCGRWTGKNAQIDKPPYKCQCGTELELLSRQERYYKYAVEVSENVED